MWPPAKSRTGTKGTSRKRWFPSSVFVGNAWPARGCDLKASAPPQNGGRRRLGVDVAASQKSYRYKRHLAQKVVPQLRFCWKRVAGEGLRPKGQRPSAKRGEEAARG